MGTLVFDGDCGFCQWCLDQALRLGVRCEHVAYQRADLAGLGLTEQMAQEAVWFVSDVQVYRGHIAIAELLKTSRFRVIRLAAEILGSRLLFPVASRIYALVAKNRYRFPGSTCRVDPH